MKTRPLTSPTSTATVSPAASTSSAASRSSGSPRSLAKWFSVPIGSTPSTVAGAGKARRDGAHGAVATAGDDQARAFAAGAIGRRQEFVAVVHHVHPGNDAALREPVPQAGHDFGRATGAGLAVEQHDRGHGSGLLHAGAPARRRATACAPEKQTSSHSVPSAMPASTSLG